MEAQVAESPYILTLGMDAASQACFDRLRRQHYPPERNQIAAHLTLFHILPVTEAVREAVAAAAVRRRFEMQVSGLRSLGRGVAFTLESAELMQIHRGLSNAFAEHLSAQDRQGFRPHVVVQNKASAQEAQALRAELEQEFQPFAVQALGLQLWRYLGGPWEPAEMFSFSL